MRPKPTLIRLYRFTAVAALLVGLAGQVRASLQDGLVAYWPLDDVVGTKTPDLVSGYDMELQNLTADDVVAGKIGRAFQFDNARQTLLKRTHSPGEQLPINQYSAITVAFWARVNGTGLIDLRLFSESSTEINDPLFNLGTDSGGASGILDFFFRQSGWTTVDHLESVGQPLDGEWHHIAFVQQEDGSRALYIDGVRDEVEIPAKEPGTWNVNTTTIGGILRANATHWLTGLMDEVILWNRALSETEVKQVFDENLTSVFPPLARDMVAYWPLDEVVGVKTPDLVSGYDMELQNLTADDLVPGKVGMAFEFDNTRQTLLKRTHSPGEQLPINQFPAVTVAFWARVNGTGLIDLRLFSESSTEINDPLFNLGTDSGGASGILDFFFRQSGWTTVDHLESVGQPLDGEWHHIAFVQEEDGSRTLYIDGVRDDVEIPPKEPGTWNVNTTTIGGILRANATHWLTGLMDDVVLWKRALTADEISSVVQDGTPVPFSKPQPLAIRSFTADLPAVAVGDTVTLRWDVTKSVQVEIDQGVGDVTAKTVSGLGSTEVTLPASRTFTLTLRRGAETLSESVAVAAISDIEAGWTLVENFDRYPAGPLVGNGGWFDLDGADFSIIEVNTNKMLAAHSGDSVAVLPLGPLTVTEGQERTLFFRLYLVGEEFEPLRGQVALTDRPLRFGNEAGDNVGPGAIISDEWGVRLIGGYNGYQNPAEFGAEPVLESQTAYNVWVDIENGPFERDTTVDPPVNLATGDTYSIFAARDGSSQRTPIVTDFAASRDPVGQADLGFTGPLLDKLMVGAIAGHSTLTNLYIDDIYLSKSGVNSTVPRTFGYTAPVGAQQGEPALAIGTSAGQIEITWSSGTLESTASLTDAWTPVAGATTSPYRTNAEGSQRFYRIRQ